MTAIDDSTRGALLRRGFALEYTTLCWNVIGIVVLHQIPTPVEIIGILLVAGGVALHQESEAQHTKDER